jgi:hypothetical protein
MPNKTFDTTVPGYAGMLSLSSLLREENPVPDAWIS